jgi:hypothetical protein
MRGETLQTQDDMGAVIRDYNENMLASMCSSKPYITDPK